MSNYGIIEDVTLELRRRIHEALLSAPDDDFGLSNPDTDITLSAPDDDLAGPPAAFYGDLQRVFRHGVVGTTDQSPF